MPVPQHVFEPPFNIIRSSHAVPGARPENRFAWR